MSEKYPFLGASPDAVVHDPTDTNPFGLAEVKCPYSFCNQTRHASDYAGIISGIIGSFENQALCGNKRWKNENNWCF